VRLRLSVTTKQHAFFVIKSRSTISPQQYSCVGASKGVVILALISTVAQVWSRQIKSSSCERKCKQRKAMKALSSTRNEQTNVINKP